MLGGLLGFGRGQPELLGGAHAAICRSGKSDPDQAALSGQEMAGRFTVTPQGRDIGTNLIRGFND